jgi:signal transduction histidine kinase
MKRLRLFLRLLSGYLRTYAGMIALCLLVSAFFPFIHLLGLGSMNEMRYALLILWVLFLALLIVTFFRYASRQLALWLALEQLPPDPNAIPTANTPLEDSYRELAMAYGREYQRQADAAAEGEAQRMDYYTLWVHQVKTPIAALGLIAQSEKPIDREQLRQEIFKIDQYAEAALTFQRLFSIRNDLDLKDTPLYPLCSRVVKKLRPLFLYRRIGLDMEPFEGSAITDEKWLGMAIEQVLSNALKYTPEGGRITISLKEPQQLSIADTGIGIRAEDVPRVFDRGFTGRIGRAGGKSSGIGLYLCKQAMHLLGHLVSLTSKQGEGTEVVFDLRRENWEPFN